MDRGNVDRDLLIRLCDRHGYNFSRTYADVLDISHGFGKKVIKGVETDVIFVQSAGKSSTHTVAMGKDGVFYGSCPAWVFKGGRDQMKPCKHLLYVLACKLGSAEARMQYYV